MRKRPMTTLHRVHSPCSAEKDGRLEVEIIPPPSPELIHSERETCEQFKEAFDEMKRLGD
jgi:hypothetical protein